MTITPVGFDSATAASGMSNPAQTAARSGAGDVSVTFAPNASAAGPLDRVGSGVVSKLKDFEASRADRSKAMNQVQGGPANPVDAAKAELLSGPASKSLSAESRAQSAVGGSGTDSALSAMTRTFDYAIETQLIVKTGSQLSTSASSLMRGQ